MGCRWLFPQFGRCDVLDAFISYSHAADERIAVALRDGLHSFAKRWYEFRALHVFLDRASLSAAPDLWGDVRRQLDDSRFLILLASPEAADSEWVGPREIRHWLSEEGRADRLIFACTAGSVEWDAREGDFDWSRTTALPAELRGALDSEPLYVDLRWAREADHLTLSDERFLGAVAAMAAPLHGRPKDELVGEDVRQHRRTRSVIRATITTLSVLTVLALLAAVIAVVERNSAQQRAQIATSEALALQADDIGPEEPGVAALLSLAAWQTKDTLQARSAIFRQYSRQWAVDRFLSASLPHGREVPTDSFSVAFSPDGTIMAFGHYDGSIALWNTRLRRLTGMLHTGPTQVFGLSFTPDGRALAAGDGDGSVTIWDVGSRRLLMRLAHPDGEAHSLAISPDGHLLAVGGYDTIALWDLPTGRLAAVLRGHAPTAVRGVAFSPDSRLLVSGSGDSTMRLWDVRRHRQLAVAGFQWSVFAVAFSPDGRTVAVGTQDGKVVTWDAERQSQDFELSLGSSVLGLAFSPDGRTIAAATSNNGIQDWIISSQQLDSALVGQDNAEYSAVAFSPDGHLIGSAGADGDILWRADPGVLRADRADVSQGYQPDRIVFTPGGRFLVAGGGFMVQVWDMRTRRPVRSMYTDIVNGLAIAGNTLAVAGAGEATLWDVTRGREIASFPGYGGAPLYSIALSRDGRTLAAATESGTVVVTNIARHTQEAVLPNGGVPAYALAFSPNGRTLAVNRGDAVALWDVPRSHLLGVLSGHHGQVEGFAFSPDGTMLATAGDDDTIVLSDVARRTTVGVLTGHADRVNAVAFSPDGTMLASGSHDDTVRLWDIAHRAEIGALTMHTGIVTDVAFAPDGTLASVSPDDLTVVLAPTDVNSWRAHLCDAVGSDLNAAELQRFDLLGSRQVCGGIRP
jgi:WD40 repeat protein